MKRLFVIVFYLHYCLPVISSDIHSVYDALNLYGIDTKSKKDHIEYLLKHSKCIRQEETLESVFPYRDNLRDLQKDIIRFVSLIQENLVIRQGAQERWQINAPLWMEEDKLTLRKAVAELGLIQEVQPSNEKQDVICVLGATHPSMMNRINYVDKLLREGKLTSKSHLILLAGERKVAIGVDESRDVLVEIAQRQNKASHDSLTETDLIKDIYEQSDLRDKFASVIIIDTPAGALTRPTTETTILELVSWLETHLEVESICFVSNQPYVAYQESVIAAVLLYKKLNVDIEVIGSAAVEEISPHKLIEALGSLIWAKTPGVLASLNIKNADQEILNDLAKLYARTPLIYSAIKGE